MGGYVGYAGMNRMEIDKRVYLALLIIAVLVVLFHGYRFMNASEVVEVVEVVEEE
eukprot:NODE_8274_length_252_cov_180.536946_g7114_i0.p1 GENE.NODE_8274_length_252_cov_180.536946_g7114_i0~~NODE_8274_length_252_cov_180.536946_g7114_i0.p1  ORF type:complete len:55 (+),score=5.64 NODE_8274_length_252_cov_180.536946_g7114_i0:24-188(+)